MSPAKIFLKNHLATAGSIITHIHRFFQDMPTSGSFREPLGFAVIGEEAGVATGVWLPGAWPYGPETWGDSEIIPWICRVTENFVWHHDNNLHLVPTGENCSRGPYSRRL
ncbi:MAG: hypothetical protein M8353_04810 [ANME-2 cluster archaeon]|nr:hypothetical protein [ANME-2 cluster archaeon]